MTETLSLLPLPFWIMAFLIAGGLWWGTLHIPWGIGLPMIAVLFTVATWYGGDAFYNNYPENHAKTFTPELLEDAWWQVVLCLIAFLLLIKPVNRAFNHRFLGSGGQILKIVTTGQIPAIMQEQITPLFKAAVMIYAILATLATLRLGSEVLYYFCPYLGHKAEPWGRDRIGQGFDSLLALAGYLQIFAFAIFGLTAALSKDGRVRILAIFACLLSWPYYFLDRTRGLMLLVSLPGILAWVFIRLRTTLLVRLAIIFFFFSVLSIWFSFVISNRTEMDIAEAVREKSVVTEQEETVGHEGLNMFEELCWINQFIHSGTYTPDWGLTYFANIVNPVPRSLWPSKPMIAIDYAIARGFGGGAASSAGVVASISTGVIGQGVVNFGRFLGPPFVGLLLSFWVAILARLDYLGLRVGRLPLYILGLVMTFNLGRDLSLLTLYPLIFGWIIAIQIEKYQQKVSLSRRVTELKSARRGKDSAKPAV